MPSIVIETERLVIREWKPTDVGSFGVLAGDPRVMRYISGGRPAAYPEVAAFVDRQIVTAALTGWCRWALELREPTGDEPQGVIGFAGPGCTFAPEIEFGWWLHPDLWGRGLATEAGRAGVDHCFHTIGIPRLTCMVHPDNEASLAVARKVGFVPAETVDHHGVTLVRHTLENPLPVPPHDPRYRRDCEGVPQGASLAAGSEESTARSAP